MDDFISLAKKPDVEEYDVLKLTTDDSPTTPTPPAPLLKEETKKPVIKPFYPSCKRILTRAPFHLKKKSQENNKQLKTDETPQINEDNVIESKTEPTVAGELTKPAAVAKPQPVAEISLEQLMSVDDVKSPERRRGTVVAVPQESEKVARLRNMLKHAEAETATLQVRQQSVT